MNTLGLIASSARGVRAAPAARRCVQRVSCTRSADAPRESSALVDPHVLDFHYRRQCGVVDRSAEVAADGEIQDHELRRVERPSEFLVGVEAVRIVERDGVRYTLLGTAHVSRASVDAVRDAVQSGIFDAIAVELDPQRLQAMTDPDAMAKMDLVQVIRTGKTALFAANLALAAYQRRLAEQLGIEPGAELKRAVLEARQRELPVHLIDREVGLTFKRAANRLGFWQRAKMGGGLLAGLFVDEEVADHDIEKLKQGDILASSFSEFASDSPELYDTVIAERDRYMAARLRESHGEAREVLAVVGAGHLEGLARHLREESRAPESVREELEAMPEKSDIPWFTIALAAFVLGGFAWGFYQGGLDVGSDLLLQWVLATGVLGTWLAAPLLRWLRVDEGPQGEVVSSFGVEAE